MPGVLPFHHGQRVIVLSEAEQTPLHTGGARGWSIETSCRDNKTTPQKWQGSG